MSDAPYKMTGTIELVGEVEQVTDKFSKRLLVISSGGKYPKPIAVEFCNEDIPAIDGARAGEEAEVRFYLGGRKWTSPDGVDKYYVSLRGKDFSVLSGAAPAANPLEGMSDLPSDF